METLNGARRPRARRRTGTKTKVSAQLSALTRLRSPARMKKGGPGRLFGTLCPDYNE